MHQGTLVRKGFISLLALALLAFVAGPAAAQNEAAKDTRPERGMGIYTEYSGIYVAPGEPVRLELTVENKGKRDENIALKLTTVPKGWKATLKGPNYVVNEVPVPGGKTKTLTFSAEPDKSVKPGNYAFQIDAQTADGKLTSRQNLNVVVREKAPVSEEIQIGLSQEKV